MVYVVMKYGTSHQELLPGTLAGKLAPPSFVVGCIQMVKGRCLANSAAGPRGNRLGVWSGGILARILEWNSTWLPLNIPEFHTYSSCRQQQAGSRPGRLMVRLHLHLDNMSTVVPYSRVGPSS